ncbi:Lrp/AsnC family transcriptional regulator [Pseudoroseicyclus tamaricis]|uniref:Lrp/AsnC family transcriptional regulator n=1 Tax=Pseudoroseicyclus tamaricis TaxID=2705421 RepID=A0A6B2JVW0_9RHOB|nr:Lrp/AsnC family transcriptional regulator [Pseudoroseicyclus tamaricis]NDV00354.1 Lrp/AsnC family transcriptional regulator [Pseudoroseicyclus tamaricis]
MDDIDRRILRELADDGRVSNQALAGRVGLSPSACLRRVQELERRRVITGYRARTDPVAMGRGFVVYVSVGLGEHTKAAQDAFERRLSSAQEVRECHNVAGAFEYLLRVETADLPSYKRFHAEVLGTIPTVRQITSYIVMGTSKDERD